MQIAIIQTEAAYFVKIYISVILKTFGHDCTFAEALWQLSDTKVGIKWAVINKSFSQHRHIMLWKDPGTQMIWVDPILIIQAFSPEGFKIVNKCYTHRAAMVWYPVTEG